MRGRMQVTVLALTLFSGACADDVTGPGSIEEARLAPMLRADAATAIADRWIVVLRDGTSSTAVGTEEEIERLRLDADVAYIEQDARVRVAGLTELPWNLQRIGQAPPEFHIVGSATGAGVHAYVIDTGVRTTHDEFGGRARHGFDAVDGGDADDCNGHGTHVAGTIGGASSGVARRATLVSVRVLDCGGTGTISDVVAGIDWVAANHRKPAVANLSIAGVSSRAVDDAVARAIDAGVVFVVAAGNEARDACGYSPARAPAAITVGATTRADAVWGLSNQGECVDLFAPGEGIESAWHTADTARSVMSGTSMAAPHVAGAVALRLQQAPHATPASVASALRDDAAHGRIDRLGVGSPDLLLQLRQTPDWRDLRDWAR